MGSVRKSSEQMRVSPEFIQISKDIQKELAKMHGGFSFTGPELTEFLAVTMDVNKTVNNIHQNGDVMKRMEKIVKNGRKRRKGRSFWKVMNMPVSDAMKIKVIK